MSLITETGKLISILTNTDSCCEKVKKTLKYVKFVRAIAVLRSFQDRFIYTLMEDEKQDREFAGTMAPELFLINNSQFKGFPLFLTVSSDPNYDSYSGTAPYVTGVILKSAWASFERNFSLPGFKTVVQEFTPLGRCKSGAADEPGTVTVKYGEISATDPPPNGTCFAEITDWITGRPEISLPYIEPGQEGWVDILVGESGFYFPKEPWTAILEEFYFAVRIGLSETDADARAGPLNIFLPAVLRAVELAANET